MVLLELLETDSKSGGTRLSFSGLGSLGRSRIPVSAPPTLCNCCWRDMMQMHMQRHHNIMQFWFGRSGLIGFGCSKDGSFCLISIEAPTLYVVRGQAPQWLLRHYPTSKPNAKNHSPRTRHLVLHIQALISTGMMPSPPPRAAKQISHIWTCALSH